MAKNDDEILALCGVEAPEAGFEGDLYLTAEGNTDLSVAVRIGHGQVHVSAFVDGVAACQVQVADGRPVVSAAFGAAGALKDVCCEIGKVVAALLGQGGRWEREPVPDVRLTVAHFAAYGQESSHECVA